MISEPVSKTGMEIADFLIDSYTNERGVHAETLLGAAAALAGEFALRAAEPILPDEGWVISTNATGLLFENEAAGEMTLWSIIRIGAVRRGLEESDLPDPGEAFGRAAASFGGSSYPPLTVPAEHYPHEWSPNACPRYRDDIARIGALRGLSMKDIAMAIALSIVLIMSKTSEILPPAIAVRLVLEIMIGVSRMPPLKAEVTGRSGAAGAESRQQQAPAEPGNTSPRPAQGFGTRQKSNGGGTISPNIGKAAGAMASHLASAYEEEDGIADAAKLIGALAALAGEFSLRATDKVGPGAPQWIVSTSVNGLLFEDEAKGVPNVWAAIRGSAREAGVAADELPDPITVVAQTAAAIGGSPFPPLTIPKEYYPAEWSPNACPRFRADIERIAKEFALSATECALALGYAIGAVLVRAASVYPPTIGTRLALEVMIGVSRMRPLTTEIT